jgi:cytochrome b6-f complex iron-sulfur subunit
MSEPAPNTADNPATPAGAATVPSKPALPPKPTPKPPAKGTGRRFFLFQVAGSAWFAFSASLAAMLLGTLRFLFPNVLSEPPSSFTAGDASSYEEGKVEDKFKDRGTWVILGRDEKNRRIIYALSTTCTHLGCTPNWLEAEKKFKCPCHGSGFKITGVNFEGPAPRPLERYAVRKTENGQVLVDKSRKFQKELGQWDDPDSYILV